MATSEDEIYSIMFSSLKHPVRRKILRMLAEKPMAFTELSEYLAVATPHLTYHLESLGELVVKMDDGRYKLSTFGLATVSAMREVEEAPQTEPKRRSKVPVTWKAAFAVLMAAVLILSSVSVLQLSTLNQLSSSQGSLAAENQQLLSWGIGTSTVAGFIQDVVQIDTSKYTITLLSNTMQYRTDLGVAEEVIKYSLTSAQSNLDVDFRFRENHFSRYQLTQIESSPQFTQTQTSDMLAQAKGVLERYKAYSGDDYLEAMGNLLDTVTQAANVSLMQGNMKLQITTSGGTVDFLWMYSEKGIDYTAKSLHMTFENRVLTTFIDGYFLFTIGSTDLEFSQDAAVAHAKEYVKTLTWTIDGKQVSGFNAADTVSVVLAPHPRGNSVALIPYWYVVLRLDQTYSGGINEVAVGMYADTGLVQDVHMLNG